MLSRWIGHPIVTSGLLSAFALVLALGLAVFWVISPRRRQAVGDLRFMLGRVLIVGVPLFGVIVVRGAVALGLRAEGWNMVSANLVGLFWGLVFIVVARIAVRLFPPTAWLLKEHRRAHREASWVRAWLRPGRPVGAKS